MPLWCGTAWLKLQAADHVEDSLLAEHDLEERVLVEQEDVAEDLIQVVEPLHILQVLREHVRLVDCQRVMKWDLGSIVGRHLAEISVKSLKHPAHTFYLLSHRQRKDGTKNTNLTNSEDVEKLLDVVIVLDGSGKLFPPQGRRQAGRHQFRDLLSNTELEIHRKKAELGI